jgi:hypothetical protein
VEPKPYRCIRTRVLICKECSSLIQAVHYNQMLRENGKLRGYCPTCGRASDWRGPWAMEEVVDIPSFN